MKSEVTLEKLDQALKDAVRTREILERYARREMTRARASSLLNVSERQVNRLMEDFGFTRDEGKRKQVDEAARKRREMREAAARQAISGKITIKQAALRAGCSQRTIYRYVHKLEAEKP